MATYPAFPQPGVLTRDDDPNFAQGLLRADTQPGSVQVTFPGLSPVSFPTEKVSADQNTGRLSFVSSNTPYRIRALREDDGEWLSQYKTYLPIEALYALSSGVSVPEALDAYTMDDSVYVVGVVYTNAQGRWARIDGDWVLLSPTDDSFTNMSAIHIDPAKADAFLDFYDQNFVTVTDAESYAAPDGD